MFGAWPAKPVLIIFLMAFIGASGASPQSAVFNAPSTDVLEPRRVSVTAEFAAHYGKHRNGGFHTLGPSAIVGVAKNVEAGANLYFTRTSGSHGVELQPHAKWRFYANEKAGVALAAGSVVAIPLNRDAGRRTTVMTYAVGSKEFARARGLRFTGGGYYVANADRDLGDTRGFIAGIEQPVTKDLTAVADWMTGRNKLGYATAGLRYSMTDRHLVEAGYSFGNSGRRNNYLSIFYTYSF